MPSTDPQPIPPDDTRAANAVAEALERHQFSDWYHALLSSAIDQTGDVFSAIEVADSAFEATPKDPGNAPEEDDAEAIGLGVKEPQ